MKFEAGQEFAHAGVCYRVLKGDRCPGDMVLEFKVDGWHRPTIGHSLICIAFKFQVEENNYPRPKHRGGYMLLDAVKEACRHGWQGVATRIGGERDRAAEKRERVWG